MFTETSDPFLEMRMPLHERVVDKLADILFASDMILDMLHDEQARDARGSLNRFEPRVRQVYDEINDLMKQLTD